MNDHLTPDKVSGQLHTAVEFNRAIDLYDCVETNENFFIGRQWEGVDSGGLPTPVFNFLKRVVLFAVANVTAESWAVHAHPLSAHPFPEPEAQQGMELLIHAVNDQLEALFAFNRLEALLRELARNAAVDGDGCTYSWWDPDADLGGGRRGTIRTELLQNTQVHFGDPNRRTLQDQPFLLIERRIPVEEARRRALKLGLSQGDADAITADDKDGGDGRLDRLGGGKVTVILRLWKDEKTETVWGYECTRNLELRPPWDLGLRNYPLTWMSWDFVQDCYHGQAMITGLIPNQIFVNKLFAMSMVSLMTLAYPKVLYDRTRVEKWSNRVGAAIAVSGPVEDVAKNMSPAAVSPQISQFIDLAVGYTQRFLGASDAALGDSRPDNAAAIIALQRAAATPMALSRQNLKESIEDLGRIYLDFMAADYGVRPVELRGEEGLLTVPMDFSLLRDIPLGVKLEAGTASYWSEIAAMQTLDNLLLQGKISTVEYLKRLPAGQISDRESLIAALEQDGPGAQNDALGLGPGKEAQSLGTQEAE